MEWNDLLKSEIEAAYVAAEGLIRMVDDLEWKPDTGDNWMTTGQLLEHITGACGATCRGFVTGDWGLPEGVDMENMSPDEMLPPAEALPTSASVEAAIAALHADKQVAVDMIDQASERMDEAMTAPWGSPPMPLGQHLLGMINHLNGHKGQLFYYLKLQGKPVNTMHYFGMNAEQMAG